MEASKEEFKAEGSFSSTFFFFSSHSSSPLLLLLTASFCKYGSGCFSEVLSLLVVLFNWSLVLFWLLNEGGFSVVVVVVLWFIAVPVGVVVVVVVVVLPSESLDFLLAGSELSATYLEEKRF